MLNWTKEQIAAVKKLLAKWGIKLNNLKETTTQDNTKEESN